MNTSINSTDSSSEHFDFGHKFVKLLSDYGVVLTLFATCVSFLSSFLTFIQWGLNYAIVATPADLIVGAMESLMIALAQIVMIFGALFITDVLPVKKLDIRFIKVLFSALSLFILISYAFGYSYPYLFIEGKNRDIIFLTILLIAIFLDILFSLILIQKNPSKSLWISVSIVHVILYLQMLAFSAVNRSDKVYLYGKSERCTSSERLVWAGSETLITSCDGPPFNSKKRYFILERADQVIDVRSEKARAK